ncbi:hypothetical protein ACJX0J_015635 [Zea mays]
MNYLKKNHLIKCVSGTFLLTCEVGKIRYYPYIICKQHMKALMGIIMNDTIYKVPFCNERNIENAKAYESSDGHYCKSYQSQDEGFHNMIETEYLPTSSFGRCSPQALKENAVENTSSSEYFILIILLP